MTGGRPVARLTELLHATTRLGRELAGLARFTGPLTALRFSGAMVRAWPEVAAARSLQPVDRRMRDFVVTLKVLGGTDLHLPAELFGGIRELGCRRVYEAEPGFAPGPGDVVVDLGANVGLFSCMAACRGARVLAIDAQAGLLAELEALARDNGLADRIEAVCGFVGPTTGLLSTPEARRAASHMGKELPPVLDLGELLAARHLARVDLLKVDIEGAEYSLMATSNTWLKQVRRIVMEVHADFGDPALLREQLRDAGFVIAQRDDELRVITEVSSAASYLFAHRRGA